MVSPRVVVEDGMGGRRIAALELDDRVDEFPRWPFWAGTPMASRREEPRFLSASWNLNKVLGFSMTASLGIRLAGTNSDPRPKTKRSNEFRFGARCRTRLLMTNWCFSNKDSAATARTPPGRGGWQWWPASGRRV
jgi:hypothetical protein